MAAHPRNRKPVRTLVVLAVLVAGLYGLLAGVATLGHAQWTPKLGLDLEGGTEMVLQPVVQGKQKVNDQQVQQAVSIIRQRVDSTGVSEAEVSTLGGSNIVVSLPGEPSQQQLDALSKSSQMMFRPVIEAQPSGQPAPTPTPSPTGSTPAPSPSSPSGKASKPATPSSSPSTSSAKGLVPNALRADNGSTKKPSSSPSPSRSAKKTAKPANPSSSPKPSPSTPANTPTQKPTNPSDKAWVTPALAQKFTQLNCANRKQRNAIKEQQVPNGQPMVACQDDGSEKFILGPVEITGDKIADATSGPEINQNGTPTGRSEVRLTFDSKGAQQFEKVTERLGQYPQGSPQNRFAMVLDGEVISAPQSMAVITNGKASITGNFTPESAKTLANQLKFGALPLSFKIQTQDRISPQLGSDQLTKGLMAGAIGLLLVVIYSLLQYRALGMVTVCSLILAGLLTWVGLTLLGWGYGYRLTMAGVTGAIVAIGITADSFIVYFERVRDEVREGRRLRSAVETGWARARRTILISDGVNFLAAAVLYILSESNVKGFAFTLGLTTLIDVAVVMLFTHPLLTLLANTEFFGGGHKWSGFDPKRLGAKGATYAGRGRVSVPTRRRPVEGGHSA
ncbi:MAG TPA: protein translocase subunit SecD [Segeticoccus sp.]|uniref:protein translocase subunit SecD n=1 Tax=Segeticoccus sp. TaxID=2706531 RepID=UPI002D7EFB88|nr:protein translocase subunit SecD [Segeticoccus sp.]HET8599643.1 protein translocase subunit SecD [Segeticoccus sp.]